MRIVFLNGWAASAGMLEEFKANLPSSYELYILDDLYRFELEVILAKIDELITQETVLMGWSLGGMLALYYTRLNRPIDQLKGLVLLNTSLCFVERPGFPEGVKRSDFNALRQLIIENDSKSFVRLFTHLMVAGSSSFKHDRRFLGSIFTTEHLADRSVLSKGLSYLETFDFREDQLATKLNTLFIFGEHDALVSTSANIECLAKKSNVSVKVIPGMGHFPFGACAREVASVIDNKISSSNMFIE